MEDCLFIRFCYTFIDLVQSLIIIIRAWFCFARWRSSHGEETEQQRSYHLMAFLTGCCNN